MSDSCVFEYEVVSGPMRAYGRVNRRGGYAVMRLDYAGRRVASVMEDFGDDFRLDSPADAVEYYRREVRDTDGRAMPFIDYLAGLYCMASETSPAIN